MKKINFYFYLLLAFVLTGCIKSSDFDDLKLDVNSSLPIGSLNFNEESLLELASVDNIVYNKDGIASIQDKTSMDLFNASDIEKIFKFGNQNIPIDMTVGSGIIPPGITIVPIDEPIEVNHKLDFESADIILEQATLSGGKIYFAVNNTNEYANLKCSIPELVSDLGTTLEFYPGETVDLSGYTLTPTDGNITIKLSGSLNNTSAIKCSIMMEDLSVSSAKGFFSRKEITSKAFEVNIDQEFISFLEKTEDFYLSDPVIELDLNSNINIPTMITLDEVSVDGVTITLKDEFNVNRFLINGDGAVKIKLDNNSFVGENQLSKLMTKSMQKVSIKTTSIINPTESELNAPGVVIPTTNSFNSDSEISGTLNWDILLSGYFKGITFNDEFDMNLDQDIKDYNYENISYAITAQNGFPFDIDLELFIDNNGTLTPLSNDLTTIPSSKNNVNPEVSAIIPGVIDEKNAKIITLNKENSNRFINAEKIVFQIKASTMDIANKRNISIYKGSFLDLNLILGVKGSIDLN